MTPVPRSSRWINRICRVYAVMLCAYPESFRIQFGREMQQVFRDACCVAITNKHFFRFIPLMLWDWLRTSFRERLATFGNLEIGFNGCWLLAVCGILDAMCAGLHLLMPFPRDPSGFRLVPGNLVWDMSVLALVTGACAIVVGLWNSGRGGSWLLSLHGLAFGCFGLIGLSPLVRGPLRFRPISLLFVLMAVSLGAFALGTARTPRLGALLGAGSLGFAFSFVVVGFGWVRLEPPYSYWIWMSSYFAFTALCMLSAAVRLYEAGPPQPASPPAGG